VHSMVRYLSHNIVIIAIVRASSQGT
jgi:hypothetical protein